MPCLSLSKISAKRLCQVLSTISIVSSNLSYLLNTYYKSQISYLFHKILFLY
nr:MAG TPA: hypothetical protein [Bacteriophage sp.]